MKQYMHALQEQVGSTSNDRFLLLASMLEDVSTNHQMWTTRRLARRLSEWTRDAVLRCDKMEVAVDPSWMPIKQGLELIIRLNADGFFE